MSNTNSSDHPHYRAAVCGRRLFWSGALVLVSLPTICQQPPFLPQCPRSEATLRSKALSLWPMIIRPNCLALGRLVLQVRDRGLLLIGGQRLVITFDRRGVSGLIRCDLYLFQGAPTPRELTSLNRAVALLRHPNSRFAGMWVLNRRLLSRTNLQRTRYRPLGRTVCTARSRGLARPQPTAGLTGELFLKSVDD